MNFIIPLEIYPFDLMFSLGQSDEKFKKSLSEHIQKEYMPTNDAFIMSFEDGCRGKTFHHITSKYTIIRLPNKPKTRVEFGTLSHEIFHAVDMIFRTIGITLSEDSDEAYAYIIGYITEKFWEKLLLKKQKDEQTHSKGTKN